MNEKIQSLMKKLDISEAEAREILAYDEDVDKGKKTEFDLTPEQEKSTRKYRQAEIIEEIANFLSEKDGFDVSIIKKEREISLIVGSNDYSITLIKHRPPKK